MADKVRPKTHAPEPVSGLPAFTDTCWALLLETKDFPRDRLRFFAVPHEGRNYMLDRGGVKDCFIQGRRPGEDFRVRKSH